MAGPETIEQKIARLPKGFQGFAHQARPLPEYVLPQETLDQFRFTRESTPLGEQLITQLPQEVPLTPAQPTPAQGWLQAWNNTPRQGQLRYLEAAGLSPTTDKTTGDEAWFINKMIESERFSQTVISPPFEGGFLTGSAFGGTAGSTPAGGPGFQPSAAIAAPTQIGAGIGKALLGLDKPTLEELRTPLMTAALAIPPGTPVTAAAGPVARIVARNLQSGFGATFRTVNSRAYLPLFRQVRADLRAAGGDIAALVPQRLYDPDPVMQAVVVPETIIPRTNIYNLAPIDPGLTRGEMLSNFMRNTLGRPFGLISDEGIATAAMRYRTNKLEGVVASDAAVFSSKHGAAIRNTFKFNKKGQIEMLAGVDDTLGVKQVPAGGALVPKVPSPTVAARGADAAPAKAFRIEDTTDYAGYEGARRSREYLGQAPVDDLGIEGRVFKVSTQEGEPLVSIRVKRTSESRVFEVDIDPDIAAGVEMDEVVGRFTRKNIIELAGRLMDELGADTLKGWRIGTGREQVITRDQVDSLLRRTEAATNIFGPGAPTIQDVAARLPRYWQHLSQDEKNVLLRLRAEIKPYLDDQLDMGIDIGVRPDIIPDGFYLPRGNAMEEGAEVAVSRVRGRFTGGRPGHEKTAEFKSMAQGIAEGWEYAPITDVLHGHISDIGTRLVNRHVSNYFLAIKDVTGMKIGLTPSARLSVAERSIIAQVNALKNKVRGRSKTLTAQLARYSILGRATGRAEHVAAAAGERFASATERAAIAAAYTAEDLTSARRIFDQAVRDARDVAVEITRNHNRIVKMGGRVTPAETAANKAADKALLSLWKAEALEGQLAKRVIEGKTQNKTIMKAINRQGQVVDRALAYMEKARKPYEDLAAKLDDLVERDMGLRGMRDDIRLLQSEGRQTERAIVRKRFTFAAANREMDVLRREYVRQTRAVERAGKRKTNAAQRVKATGEAIESFQDELDNFNVEYNKAVRKSKETPRGFATIDMLGLNNHVFPVEIADAASKVLTPQPGPLGPVYMRVKNMMQALNATADFSASAIQGLLGLHDNPRAFGQAMWVQLQAWGIGGDKVLGQYIQMFDENAARRGLLSAREWARRELRIGGQDIGEFRLGGGTVSKLPVIRQANRAFGFFGDTLRLEWAESMLVDELAIGRTLQEIEASGDMLRIINSANSMTGWARGRAFGSFGDALLFANRFLQSRLDTVARAGMGVLREPLPGVRIGSGGATLDQRLAQRSLLKTVGSAVILTEIFNRMQGRETDWNIFTTDSDGKRIPNPNFMAIRAFGRDWKILGTWDSLAKAIILTGMGRPQDALRNMAAPPVSLGWDLVSGSTLIGERTRDTQLQAAQTIVKSLLPFATDELPEIAKKASEGQVVAASATLIGEMGGAKSAPLGYVDVSRDVAAELFPDTQFEDLNRAQLRQVNEDDRVQDQIKKIEERAEPLTDRQRLNQAFDALDATRSKQEKAFRAKIDDGSTGTALRKKISEFKTARFHAGTAIMDQTEIVKIMKTDKKQVLSDTLAERFWTMELLEDSPGHLDFAGRDDKRDEVLEEAKKNGVPKNYITGTGEGTYRGKRFDDPVVRAVIEDYEDDMASVRPYYDILVEQAERYGQEDKWKEYLGSPQKSAFLSRPENVVLKMIINQVVPMLREDMRRENAEIERALWKWGLVERMLNPTVAAEVYFLRQKQGGTITDTRAISGLGIPE